ncbi:T-complex protein 1 subunit theta [Camelus dromedarius]|uniref:T-complex protein 1 subunit theta n=1 Tax=Camelus dromedarius TaxID=9838 RepID=A0A5N4EIQ8_CAMDR|nr:T-complex protein 1 subunit theta [Camelus dromedarius]
MRVVVFKHKKEDGAIFIIVVRGSTDNLMDNIEKAVDDGINTFKVLTRDKHLVPGGGATEVELVKQITSYGDLNIHQEGSKNVGLDIEAEVPAVKDMLKAGVKDTYLRKYWAIKLATNAAVTILRVNQIIMAKSAGEPKPPSGKKDWDDDQNV